MNPVLAVGATGVVAFLLWKVLLVLLLPFVGIAVGFVFLALKVVFIVAAICVAIWLVRRSARQDPTVA